MLDEVRKEVGVNYNVTKCIEIFSHYIINHPEMQEKSVVKAVVEEMRNPSDYSKQDFLRGLLNFQKDDQKDQFKLTFGLLNLIQEIRI